MGNKIGGNNRKKGRMKVWCQAYANRQQRDRNKARRLAKHLRSNPWDDEARQKLMSLPDGFRKGLKVIDRMDSPSATRAKLGMTLTQLKSSHVMRAA